jgi:hypothetical protein
LKKVYIVHQLGISDEFEGLYTCPAESLRERPYDVNCKLDPVGAGLSPFAYQAVVLSAVLTNHMASRNLEVSPSRARKPNANSPDGESHEVSVPAELRLEPSVMLCIFVV